VTGVVQSVFKIKVDLHRIIESLRLEKTSTIIKSDFILWRYIWSF